jgi:bifunctional UDP-N-acetylglucosamine pyrophosphorylase/glucosamine-1-phosphate N-acetyltransferase
MNESTTAAPARPLACIVMAGGKGTRMRSALPKVLHELCGRPILGWVLAAAREAGAERLVVVTPPADEAVHALVGDDAEAVVQPQALGTGDAVRCGLAALDGFHGDVLVVSGDTPLIRGELLHDVVASHRAGQALATLLTVHVPPPNAYGRVVRDADDGVVAVVEARDASPAELALTEINAGFYAFDVDALRAAVAGLRTDNVQGELYLPDVLPMLRAQGGRIVGHVTDDEVSTMGVNTRVDLAEADRHLRLRLLTAHMLAGVGIVDPATTFVEHGVTLEPDCTIHPFTVLRGTTHVAAGARVGPHAVLVDARVGANALVGPFCYLRPGATLAARAKAGTFVEIKNSTVGEGAKVPHLSYIGDAEIGEGTNIGAGNITGNYHAGRKNRTTIGARVSTGSDNVFVAPVTVGDDASTAAGSIITEDVPPGALAIARARQVNKDGYALRYRHE